MSSSPLRWLLAAALAAGALAGLYFTAADGIRLRTGGAADTVERLVGKIATRHRRGHALELSGSREVRESEEIGRSGGLGSRLVESGRPRRPLLPLNAGRPPASGAISETRAVPPAHLKPPAPTRKERAGVRSRSVAAARGAVGGPFAAKRRRIPARDGSSSKIKAALRAAQKVPRIGAAYDRLPELRAEPQTGPGEPVAPPETAERLPAPVVELP